MFLVDVLYRIGPFLLVLTPLVFFHELGHYLVARWRGVKIEMFSIGFGPEIVGWTDRLGTRWKISAVPLGGYVKMYGDEDASSKPSKKSLKGASPRELRKTMWGKKPWEKIAIAFAGPLANYILAFVLFFGIFFTHGIGFIPSVVEKVIPQSIGERVGFQKGDQIEDLNGEEIKSFSEVVRIIAHTPLKEMVFGLLRKGERREIYITKQEIEAQEGSLKGKIGLVPGAPQYRKAGFWESVTEAFYKPLILSKDIVIHVGRLISGSVSTQSMGGVLMIAKLSSDVSQQGLVALILFAAVLSVNLGLMNLLPIPVLDGGHILLYGAEFLGGRSFSERFVEWFYRIGFGFILFLFLWTTWNDLYQLKVIQFFKQTLKSVFA